MDKLDIINGLINKCNFQSYLEIGVDTCINFLKVQCKYKECVDPFEIVEGSEYPDTHESMNPAVRDYIESNILTHKMTSDEFFEKCPSDKKYDIIFIDGLHTEEQVGKDIINSFKHLNLNGFIVVHDCLPGSYEEQTEIRHSAFWNGTVWKAIPMMGFQGINYNTIDCDTGVAILRYGGNPESLVYPEKSNFDYNNVFSDAKIRNIVMKVIDEETFRNYIS